MRGLIAGALITVFPVVAGADYLNSAFRDGCAPSTSENYSASDPVIGTVPQLKSEVDRVASNLLVYTGFKVGSSTAGTDDYRGHVYAVRLFKEQTEFGNDWAFTDTGNANLLSTCGDEGSACLFDAGQVLQDRTAERRIFVGKAGTAEMNAGALTVPMSAALELPSSNGVSVLREAWDAYVAVPAIAGAMPSRTLFLNSVAVWNCRDLPWLPKSLCEEVTLPDVNNLRKPSDNQLDKLGKWLHGKSKDWKLGDIYHSSATIVEPPGFDYLDRFYPEFKDNLHKRPSMIYVGANDGMIHAFYASPDLYWEDDGADAPRWELGEEAWAYLPMNTLSKALFATETDRKRFFSQDLSCRYTDVQVDRQYRTECTDEDKADDPYCGWRTVLLCGQGWGGSWYTALDVTDPSSPKPMWEFTHTDDGTTPVGLGRTWSLPAVAMVPMHDADTGRTEPFWIATFGSGFNSAMKNSVGTPKAGYRLLNLNFDGDHPQHGQGTKGDTGTVYTLDVASGKVVKRFAGPGVGMPFVADGTVLDFNYDGIVDAAYMAQYKGMHRVRLAKTAANMTMCRLSTLSNDTVLSGHPTAFAYRQDEGATKFPVVLITGAGLDSGKDPDQQANNGNKWSVDSNLYLEQPGAACATGGFYCDLAPGFNGLNDGSRKARLLGAPLFTRQASGDDWILYSIWTAPHFNKVDGCPTTKDEKTTGNAHLLCMDVTLKPKTEGSTELVPRCVPCEGFEDFGSEDTLIYENESNPPNAPVSADGRVYLTDPNAGIYMREVTGTGGSPAPNSRPPEAPVPARIISWREVF